ncbi:MAG: tRNA 2-thiouridine(34) synthase MnmA, partial [Oscillospiraceae bacterium]|nr:tRNA 2-thiouridine(34) synthase MnmA [Oscillospiraceae bacterium]
MLSERKQRVVVGLSGGVDSAAAAYLLKLSGYEVIGVTLRTWVSADGQESRCCEISDARMTADLLGIPYYVVNCQQAFRQAVTEPFIRSYSSGLTPNPCILCNRHIKWEKLLEAAARFDAALIATGHYASIMRLANGRYTV